jgi:hypothetical protein
MTTRSRPAGWFPATARRAALALSAAFAAVSCGTTTFGSGGAGQPRAVVPWVNRPGRIIWPRALPRHFIPATARPCTAADLRVFPAGGNGATGHSEFTFGLRNIGATTCLLKGYPRVVATEPGHKRVIATDGGYLVGRERAGNMRPGAVTWLNLETNRDCPAHNPPSGGSPMLVYHAVTVSVPGGGKVVLHQGFDVLCGLFTGQFGVTEPPQRYINPPWTRVRVALELPASVTAGTVLHYVVDLINPTSTPMRLSPCLGYSQGIAVAGKSILQLNCAGVPGRLIPGRRTVRFAMRITVPAGTPTGPTWVGWTIAGSVTAYAHGSVRVIGDDIPCTAAKLKAAITGPGQVPAPPNLLGMKGYATAVPLAVTNVSARPCSVYGQPDVVIRAANGRQLKLTQVPYTDYQLTPSRPLQPVIILAPHGGTARTTLYWYLPWCAANPNPVTVSITFPANHARLSVTPAGGWTPPACRSRTASGHGGLGEVSADPFRAG